MCSCGRTSRRALLEARREGCMLLDATCGWFQQNKAPESKQVPLGVSMGRRHRESLGLGRLT